MLAAKRFVHELATDNLLCQTDALTIDLYGSLALTEKGHARIGQRKVRLGAVDKLLYIIRIDRPNTLEDSGVYE